MGTTPPPAQVKRTRRHFLRDLAILAGGVGSAAVLQRACQPGANYAVDEVLSGIVAPSQEPGFLAPTTREFIRDFYPRVTAGGPIDGAAIAAAGYNLPTDIKKRTRNRLSSFTLAQQRAIYLVVMNRLSLQWAGRPDPAVAGRMAAIGEPRSQQRDPIGDFDTSPTDAQRELTAGLALVLSGHDVGWLSELLGEPSKQPAPLLRSDVQLIDDGMRIANRALRGSGQSPLPGAFGPPRQPEHSGPDR